MLASWSQNRMVYCSRGCFRALVTHGRLSRVLPEVRLRSDCWEPRRTFPRHENAILCSPVWRWENMAGTPIPYGQGARLTDEAYFRRPDREQKTSLPQMVAGGTFYGISPVRVREEW